MFGLISTDFFLNCLIFLSVFVKMYISSILISQEIKRYTMEKKGKIISKRKKMLMVLVVSNIRRSNNFISGYEMSPEIPAAIDILNV